MAGEITEKVVLLYRSNFERGRQSPLFHYPVMSKDEISATIEAFIRGTDQFLVDIHLSPSKLAIFLDKPSGIQLEECSALNRHLLSVLEPTGFLEKHDIEVSSPGMDMPLKVHQQYLRRIGREISVIDKEGKAFQGHLQQADQDSFEVLSVTEKKEKKVKIRTEALKKFKYDEVRESKLVLNFKIK